MSVRDDLDIAFRLVNDHLHNEYFEERSPIYLGPTGNVKETIALYKNVKEALAVSGCGAFGFELLLNGAKRVDFFDKNRFQYYYFLLFKEAITHFSYSDFCNYFTMKNQEYRKKDTLLSRDIYDKLCRYLPEEAERFWGNLFDWFEPWELLTSGLFYFKYFIDLPFLKEHASFYEEESYGKLQTILRSDTIESNFYIYDIKELREKIDQQYDLIVLGNILQYHEGIEGLEEVSKIDQFIKHELTNLLTSDGMIQVDYAFEISTSRLKFLLNPKDNCLEEILKNPIRRFTLERGMENDRIVQLYQNFKDYHFDFISGVEKNESSVKENVVVTYVKK